MSMLQSDPRVFFAAERTLLAWLRTGLTIIGIGFVVSRFGLFLHLLSLQSQPRPTFTSSFTSTGLGITFVAVGSLAILIAAVQQHRFVATLSSTDLPPAYSRNVAVLLSLVVAALGVALAAYLFVSPR